MAGSRSLGVLTLDLAVKTGAFSAGMSQAERAAKQSTGRITSIFKGLGTALGLSLAGIATGVAASLKGAIDRMDELRDASIRLGIGTEVLSAYGYAAQQTGTDIEALEKGLKILAKTVAASSEGKGKAKIFEALGIGLKDAQGNLRELDALIPEIADRFKALEDGTTKAALAQALFGKSGLELTEFLNQGSEGLKTMADRARELGIVIDQETAAKADEFNDTLADLKTAVMGLATQVAADLLPDLIELTRTIVDWIKEGDAAGVTADELRGLFSGLADTVKVLWAAFDSGAMVLKGVAYDLAALYKVAEAGGKLKLFDFAGARASFEEAKAFRAEAAAASQQIEANYRSLDAQAKKTKETLQSFGPNFNIPGLGGGQKFSAVPTVADSSKPQIDTTALGRALGGYKPPKEKKAKTGKSDAEREAERIKDAIEKMTKAQREWQAELDGTGNKIADDYAKRLAEINEQAKEFAEKGVPTEKVAAFREEMTRLAEAIKSKETTQFLADFNAETEEMLLNATGASTANYQFAKSIEELNKQLADGIIGQEEYAKRAEALAAVRDSSAMQVLRDIETEQSMLGLSIEQQDTLNKLRYAGVDANSAYGQSIIDANHALHEQAQLVSQQIEFMDEFRSGLADAFVDFISGAKSAKEAFSDFFDDLAAKLLRMIVENWIERAFGEMGSTGGGTSGGGWLATLAGAVFGSGKAAGGPVMPGMIYPVNENRMEMVSYDGRDFLLTGNKQGSVKPAQMGAQKSGDTFVTNFNFHGRDEQQSREQALALQEQEQRRVRIRNGNR